MIEPGTHLEITYPTITHVKHFEHCNRCRRSITIRRVRDLVDEPLTADEFLRRPFVMRSRWLVLAFDNNINDFRQFYLGSSEEFDSPGQLRLALYKPFQSKPIELMGREFSPTVSDRKLVIRLLNR